MQLSERFELDVPRLGNATVELTDYTLSELLDLPEEEIKEMLELERVKQIGKSDD